MGGGTIRCCRGPGEREIGFGALRFYDFNLWSERKRVEKLRYMHRNPVKCGLVAEPEHWERSSCRSYSYQEEGRVKINRTPAFAPLRRMGILQLTKAPLVENPVNIAPTVQN